MLNMSEKVSLFIDYFTFLSLTKLYIIWKKLLQRVQHDISLSLDFKNLIPVYKHGSSSSAVPKTTNIKIEQICPFVILILRTMK